MSPTSYDPEKGDVQSSPSPQVSVHHPRPSRIANPAALGFFSFASTTFLLSMYNTQVRHITQPNVVVGMAVFCGGLCQLLSGMWEFPRGNMFGATAFTSYGAFWMSYATILIPGSGIIAAFGGNTKEFNNAVAIYLIAWLMFTFFLALASLRKNIALISLFVILEVTFGCLIGGSFNGNANVTKAGGVTGVITAFVAYYLAASELLSAEPYPVFTLPLGVIKGSD